MLIRLSMGGELHDEEDLHGNPLNPTEIAHEFFYDAVCENPSEGIGTDSSTESNCWMDILLGMNAAIRNKRAHVQLREAICAHIWNTAGSQYLFH